MFPRSGTAITSDWDNFGAYKWRPGVWFTACNLINEIVISSSTVRHSHGKQNNVGPDPDLHTPLCFLQHSQTRIKIDQNRYHLKMTALYIDGLVQERRNSIANALELHFFALTHRHILAGKWIWSSTAILTSISRSVFNQFVNNRRIQF